MSLKHDKTENWEEDQNQTESEKSYDVSYSCSGNMPNPPKCQILSYIEFPVWCSVFCLCTQQGVKGWD